MHGEQARQQMAALDFDETWTSETAPADYPSFQWRGENCPAGRLTGPADAGSSDNDGDADGFGPGFGLCGGLAGTGVAAYLLWRGEQSD
jgi:hypothetical protein